mmetsp:Transcript_8333/g.25113  ORF Transcript_8333/g.25113 Transcript_8333/m.25113 type:complete len:219 (-) Transcript_8333:906-1562(-)
MATSSIHAKLSRELHKRQQRFDDIRHGQQGPQLLRFGQPTHASDARQAHRRFPPPIVPHDHERRHQLFAIHAGKYVRMRYRPLHERESPRDAPLRQIFTPALDRTEQHGEAVPIRDGERGGRIRGYHSETIRAMTEGVVVTGILLHDPQDDLRGAAFRGPLGRVAPSRVVVASRLQRPAQAFDRVARELAEFSVLLDGGDQGFDNVFVRRFHGIRSTS